MVRPGFGAQVQAFVGQSEIADDVVEVFDAGAVGADVVRAPPAAELVATRGQLAHEVVQTLVVGVSPLRAAVTVVAVART